MTGNKQLTILGRIRLGRCEQALFFPRKKRIRNFCSRDESNELRRHFQAIEQMLVKYGGFIVPNKSFITYGYKERRLIPANCATFSFNHFMNAISRINNVFFRRVSNPPTLFKIMAFFKKLNGSVTELSNLVWLSSFQCPNILESYNCVQ